MSATSLKFRSALREHFGRDLRRKTQLIPVFFAVLLFAVSACHDSGSLDLNINLPTTRTSTPLPNATDTPPPNATDTPPLSDTNTPAITGTPGGTVTFTPTAMATSTAQTPGTTTPAPASSATSTPSPTGTLASSASETETETPTPTPAEKSAGLPDLVLASIVVVAPTPVGGCVDNLSDWMVSLQVCVRNQGDADAGPFDVDLQIVSGEEVSFTGAAADSVACENAPFVFGQIVVTVDSNNNVAESDETNNQSVVSVQNPTPPPICS